MKNLFNFIILILILLVLILLGSIFFGDKNYNLRDDLKLENDLQKNVNQELIKFERSLLLFLKVGSGYLNAYFLGIHFSLALSQSVNHCLKF